MKREDIEHLAARLAELRDEELAEAERARSAGARELSIERWAAVNAYRQSLHALYAWSNGQHGASADDQPNVSWVKDSAPSAAEGGGSR